LRHLKGKKQAKGTEAPPDGLQRLGLVKQKKKVVADRAPPPDAQKRLVVKCDPTSSQQDCVDLLSSRIDHVTIVHNLPGIHSLAIEVDSSTRALLETMGVQLEEDHVREPLYLKDSIQYHRELDRLQTIPDGVDAINARQVWEEYDVRGEGVKICVLDTGVFAAHPDFAATDLTGYSGTEGIAMTPWDEDVRGHGTHVTGIIAASGNDDGVVGVAPGAEIYVMRVFRDNGNFYGSDIVAAAEACRDVGANIISMSLGGDTFDQGEHDIFEELYREGILAVASSGNSGSSDTIYPAAYNKVLSVTASDEIGNIADFSTVNSHVNIAAPGKFHILRPASNPSSSFVLTRSYLFLPGVDIRSTWNDGLYVSISGTSMAAPHVSGVLALLLSYRPDTPLDVLATVLQSTSHQQASRSGVHVGIVDAFAAIEALRTGDYPTAVDNSCIWAEFHLRTDRYGGDTDYRLQRRSDREILWSGSGLRSNEEYTERTCVDPDDCYQFQIRDMYRDGIEGEGILLSYDGVVSFQGGDIGAGGYRRFGSC
jgi:hypothetical protein